MPLYAVIDELAASGEFTYMDHATDEDEHSIEMHLPYIRKVFENFRVSIVPILVGAISPSKEQKYGKLLAHYFNRSDTLFVVSTDFCHWGTRFSFTHYCPLKGGDAIRLDRKNANLVSKERPIYQSISELDREGMDILATLSPTVSVHQKFSKYLARTGNTICGRHPIGVLMGAIESVEGPNPVARLKWVRYEQSSVCETVKDSSVSYASGYVAVGA